MQMQSKIKKLYDSGKNSEEIAMAIFLERKVQGINTTVKDCKREVEDTLLEIHRRRIKA